MGYRVNKTLIITAHDHSLSGGNVSDIQSAYNAAEEILSEYGHHDGRTLASLLTPIMKPMVNGHSSFMVATSGSNSGWYTALQHDGALNRIVEWLRSAAWEDGSNRFEYVLLEYGGDGATTKIIVSSDIDFLYQ